MEGQQPDVSVQITRKQLLTSNRIYDALCSISKFSNTLLDGVQGRVSSSMFLSKSCVNNCLPQKEYLTLFVACLGSALDSLVGSSEGSVT